jgi:acyl-CoA synthetase (AMP-forming)/AMP-acid ligase II
MRTTTLLPDLILDAAERAPEQIALRHRMQATSYGRLAGLVAQFAGALASSGLRRGDRVGVYLPKQLETVVTLFGANQAGGVFVPLNPVLKAAQVGHILRDCDLRVLVTSADRLASLATELAGTPALERVVLRPAGQDGWRLAGVPGCRVDHRALPPPDRHRRRLDPLHLG